MGFVFSSADRRMFKTAQKIIGGPPGEMLESHLGDGVFGDHCPGPDSSAQIREKIDGAYVRRAGSDELELLCDCLGTGEIPSAIVLRSLRASLLGPGHPGLDLQIRAGLHRLGRAVADLESSALSRITAHLPGAWGRCAQAAWFRLSREEECRKSASSLREFLASGGAS